jgi:hypothetical protein
MARNVSSTPIANRMTLSTIPIRDIMTAMRRAQSLGPLEASPNGIGSTAVNSSGMSDKPKNTLGPRPSGMFRMRTTTNVTANPSSPMIITALATNE